VNPYRHVIEWRFHRPEQRATRVIAPLLSRISFCIVAKD